MFIKNTPRKWAMKYTKKNRMNNSKEKNQKRKLNEELQKKRIWVNCPVIKSVTWLSSLGKYRFRTWNRIKYVKMFISFRPGLRNKKTFSVVIVVGISTVTIECFHKKYSFASFFSLCIFVFLFSLLFCVKYFVFAPVWPNMYLAVYTSKKIWESWEKKKEEKTHYKMFNSV